MDVPIELCTSAKVYKPDQTRRLILFSLLVALYSISLPYCYFSAGEPRQAAILQAQKVYDERWLAEASVLVPDDTNSTINEMNSSNYTEEIEGENLIFSGTAVVEEQAVIDEFDTDQLQDSTKSQRSDSGNAVTNYITSFFTPSKEQQRAKKEFDQWQKEFKEKSGETVALPPEYLPSAWACLALFATITIHALFHLMCHWVVSFKALTLYQSARKVEENCSVLIIPPPNRGSAAMVTITKSKTTGLLQVEFQRQKYIYTPAVKLGDKAAKFKNGVLTLFAYPVNLPLSHYISSNGIRSDNEVEKLIEKWGKNHFSVAIPSFLELLQMQLVTPLAIFQIFCALLWLLDEYWSYTFFTLVSVVVFEATTVFQRSRTQNMLGGMSPKPSPIYVFRSNRWCIVTTKDLLPGDIISLSFKKRSAINNNLITNNKPANAPVSAPTSNSTSKDEIVPCDCILLRGAAVVNEASLTGESVPQMKEALTYHTNLTSSTTDESGLSSAKLPAASTVNSNTVNLNLSNNNNSNENVSNDDLSIVNTGEEKLDITQKHRVHTLYSGTSIVTVTGLSNTATKSASVSATTSAASASASVATGFDAVPPPPDHGATAYVLKTGFGSSQGSLLQMIEFSQQAVSGDSRETGLALLVLFVFALIASSYVLQQGLIKKEKTTHELLLKCVIIITSVVPRQFPMQMAMAVNMALMALTKAGIFCTEPFRVPLAGKVSHCLFDKTGTLTTDQLMPVGVISADGDTEHSTSNNSSSSGRGTGSERTSDVPTLRKVITAKNETAMILAACHSLVVIESDTPVDPNDDDEPTTASSAASTTNDINGGIPSSNLVGDPIELAAMKAIDWSWDASISTATPDGGLRRQRAAYAVVRQKLATIIALPNEQRTAQDKKVYTDLVEEQKTLERRMEESCSKAKSAKYTSIQVLQRHHFSSALQRMSVVCRCHDQNRQDDYSNLTGSTSNTIMNNTERHASTSNATTGASNTTRQVGMKVGTAGGADDDFDNIVGDWYCLVKGSPEALLKLMKSDGVPQWYSKCYESLARQGLRVLALAYKQVSYMDKPAEKSRSWVESELSFGGFIAFECKIRSDSGIVIGALLQSDHKVMMLTGDALLTSLHVAQAVGICEKRKKGSLTLQFTPDEDASSVHSGTDTKATTVVRGTSSWVTNDANVTVQTILPFDATKIPALNQDYDLLTTEDVFLRVVAATGGELSVLWKHVGLIKVFARMSPQGKASIIRAIQDHDKDAHVFMCGDGGNDVGALKQANVGLALLSGHANANTDNTSTDLTAANPMITNAASSSTTTATTTTTTTTGNAEDKLNEREKEIKKRNDELTKLRQAHMKEFQARFTREQHEQLQEELKQLTERGEYLQMFSLMKAQAGKIKQAMAEENVRFMAMHGQAWDPKKDVDVASTGGGLGSIEKLMESMDGGDTGNGLPMVRPGDASVAAPFTSRIPSVKAVVDLIRQGRCTLLSALMQQQIMMLESIIAAYTLSALSLHNARSSERQMMASSWLLMTAAVSFSYASPLDKMHPLRPLRSLFHPAIFISILGQAVIHIACMTLAVSWATEAMGPEALKEVTEFFKKVKSNEIDRMAHCGEDDMMCQMQAYWTAPFMPNLLNSVCFLVETSQMISVYFANYKGRPWMKGMLENHPLFLSVFLCVAGVVVAAWEFVPQLNEVIQLAPFPDDAFRYKVVFLVMATIAGTFLWDRLCIMLFAPQIFAATIDEFKRTSVKDFLPIFMTVFKILGVLLVLGTGNILLAGAAFWWYRSYKSKQDAA